MQIIQYDTARRLHFPRHISLNAIDAFEIFDTPVRRIIRTVCHRCVLPLSISFSTSKINLRAPNSYYLRWPGSQLDTLPMFTLAGAAPPRGPLSTLYDDLTAFLPTFCANLNCLIPSCKFHGPSPAFVPPTPRLTGGMMQELEGEACGEKFYKNASEDDVNFMVCSYWALGLSYGC